MAVVSIPEVPILTTKVQKMNHRNTKWGSTVLLLLQFVQFAELQITQIKFCWRAFSCWVVTAFEPITLLFADD